VLRNEYFDCPQRDYLAVHYILKRGKHRDRKIEQQQTEKIETEVKDVDSIQYIRITKVYASCPEMEFVNVHFRLGFWAESRDFSDLGFLP
jgi:hypothetical protein